MPDTVTLSGRRRKGRLLRRSRPIHGYVGPNGGGKSLAMVYDTLPSLDAGRTVLSTVPLYDGAGELHPCYVPFTDYRQLLAAESCDVLMDEVTGIASSRESHSMPVQVANFLVQLRRRDVVLRWTAPNFRRADVIMRECTQAVTECRGFAAVEASDGDRMWRDRRLFVWRTYDAADFDDWSAGKRDKVQRLAVQLFWRPGKPVEGAYDTREAVHSLGAANEAGRCMVCWGTRRAHKCECAPGAVEHWQRALSTAAQSGDLNGSKVAARSAQREHGPRG